MREVLVKAVVNDPYDGLIRLLGDAQRFGFELRASTLVSAMDGSASVTLTLSVPARMDVQLVAARLVRHPAVLHLDAQVSPTPARATDLYAIAA
jgi:hypothetical protein